MSYDQRQMDLAEKLGTMLECGVSLHNRISSNQRNSDDMVPVGFKCESIVWTSICPLAIYLSVSERGRFPLLSNGRHPITVIRAVYRVLKTDFVGRHMLSSLLNIEAMVLIIFYRM